MCIRDSGQTERYDDAGTNLDQTGSTEVATTTSTTMSYLMTSGAGNWATKGVAIKPITTGAHAASNPMIITKTITTPPRGFYRVLVRVNENGTGPDIRMGVSLDSSADPSVTGDYTALSGSSFHFVDIGTVTIPLVDTPDNMTAGSVTLRVAVYDVDTSNKDGYLNLDSLFLLPVDFGAAIVNKASGTNRILVDGISKHRVVTLLDTSDVVQSAPAAQSVMAPQVHPLGTRCYMVSDNSNADKDDGWVVDVTLEHRFLSLRGST